MGVHLIPTIRAADLVETERRVLERVLQAPALWPFQVAMSFVGLDAAVEACRSRKLPAAVEARMAPVGWSANSLPPVQDIEAILLGVRVEAALRAARSSTKPKPSIVELAERFGANRLGALRGVKVMRQYAGETRAE